MLKEEVLAFEKTGKDLSQEVSAVFDLIREYRANVNSSPENFETTRLERVTTIIAVIAFVIISVTLIGLKYSPELTQLASAESIRRSLQLLVLSIYILGGMTLLFQFLTLKSLFSNLTGKLVDTAEDMAKDDMALRAGLNSLSRESIECAANRLELMNGRLGSIRSFSIGAIEKIGIVPGLLATLVAINKIPSSGGISWVESLSFSLIGIYAAMFLLHSASLKLGNIASVLNQYLASQTTQNLGIEK